MIGRHINLFWELEFVIDFVAVASGDVKVKPLKVENEIIRNVLKTSSEAILASSFS